VRPILVEVCDKRESGLLLLACRGEEGLKLLLAVFCTTGLVSECALVLWKPVIRVDSGIVLLAL